MAKRSKSESNSNGETITSARQLSAGPRTDIRQIGVRMTNEEYISMLQAAKSEGARNFSGWIRSKMGLSYSVGEPTPTVVE